MEADMRFGTALVLSLAIGAGACATVPIFEPQEWNATVEPTAGNEARANVRAVTAPGQTAIAINLAGGAGGAAHPWHIHRGSCGSGGAVVGAMNAYPLLRPNSAGAATATALIRVQLVPGESYHVNVHQSEQAMNQIIACGELR
jgi:hypothetical protein